MLSEDFDHCVNAQSFQNICSAHMFQGTLSDGTALIAMSRHTIGVRYIVLQFTNCMCFSPFRPFVSSSVSLLPCDSIGRVS